MYDNPVPTVNDLLATVIVKLDELVVANLSLTPLAPVAPLLPVAPVLP